MILIRLLILIACLATIPPGVSHGASNLPSAGDITIKADSMKQNLAEDSFIATGHVEVQWHGMVLNADEATFNRKTGMLVATGNIVMIKGNDILKGTTFSMNLETGRIELEHGDLSVRQGNVSFTGEKIVREDDINVVLTKGELTTCDLPDPAWKFGAERLRVNLLGYAIGRNIVFYIKGMPVLYLPWIAFPVVKERRSGFLFPRFGLSNTRGFEVDIPVYWVIAPNQDALVDINLLTKRGVGTGLEYRYARNRSSEGSAGGYLIYDLLEEQWRGQFTERHKEIFSPDMNLRTDINLNSDRNFLSEFGEKSGDYNRQFNESTANFLKTWQHYAFTGGMRYSEGLYNVDTSHTAQTFPEIGLAAVRQQIAATPLYFDLDANAANLFQDADPSGQRLLAFPRLTLVTGLPGYLNASAFAGAHLRGYNTDSVPPGTHINGTDGDLMPEAGARFSTSLSRVYSINGEQLKKLRHELVPELTYSYIPEHDQTRLPFYDFSDRLVWQNIAYYSLTNHVQGKFQHGESNEYRDLLRFKIMQGYSFEGTRRDLLSPVDANPTSVDANLASVDANHHWTDLILEADAWPHPWARLTFDGRYNLHDRAFSSVSPGLEINDTQGNSVGISYRKIREVVEYLEGHVGTKMFKPWRFGYSTRFSYDRPGGYLDGFLESIYSVEYRQKCWSVSVALTDRPGSTSFGFNFTLAGIVGR